MNLSLRPMLLAAAGCCLFAVANAKDAVWFKPVTIAAEAAAGSVVLPSGASSALVMTPCRGCVPKSFIATSATSYFLRHHAVTLSELKAAVAGRPDLALVVEYDVKSGELVSITAPVDAAPRKQSR